MQQSSQHEYHRHHWHHGHKRTSTTSPTSQKSQTLSSRTSGICTSTHGAGSFKVEVLAKFETTLENDFLAETSAQVSFYFILNKPGLENVFSWRGRELDEISCSAYRNSVTIFFRTFFINRSTTLGTCFVP